MLRRSFILVCFCLGGFIFSVHAQQDEVEFSVDKPRKPLDPKEIRAKERKNIRKINTGKKNPPPNVNSGAGFKGGKKISPPSTNASDRIFSRAKSPSPKKRYKDQRRNNGKIKPSYEKPKRTSSYKPSKLKHARVKRPKANRDTPGSVRKVRSNKSNTRSIGTPIRIKKRKPRHKSTSKQPSKRNRKTPSVNKKPTLFNYRHSFRKLKVVQAPENSKSHTGDSRKLKMAHAPQQSKSHMGKPHKNANNKPSVFSDHIVYEPVKAVQRKYFLLARRSAVPKGQRQRKFFITFRSRYDKKQRDIWNY